MAESSLLVHIPVCCAKTDSGIAKQKILLTLSANRTYCADN